MRLSPLTVTSFGSLRAAGGCNGCAASGVGFCGAVEAHAAERKTSRYFWMFTAAEGIMVEALRLEGGTMTIARISAAALLALLAACGGSSGNAALSKSFTYGAASAPNSQESAAASTAQTNLSSTRSFSTQADA